VTEFAVCVFNRKKGTHAMKRSKFSEEQIAYALKQNELGSTVEELCRKMGISEATFYLWKKKYQSLGPSEVRRLRQLEEESRKLKQIVADSRVWTKRCCRRWSQKRFEAFAHA
jgi:putative transposase